MRVLYGITTRDLLSVLCNERWLTKKDISPHQRLKPDGSTRMSQLRCLFINKPSLKKRRSARPPHQPRMRCPHWTVVRGPSPHFRVPFYRIFLPIERANCLGFKAKNFEYCLSLLRPLKRPVNSLRSCLTQRATISFKGKWRIVLSLAPSRQASLSVESYRFAPFAQSRASHRLSYLGPSRRHAIIKNQRNLLISFQAIKQEITFLSLVLTASKLG